jgi:hypothetical protein
MGSRLGFVHRQDVLLINGDNMMTYKFSYVAAAMMVGIATAPAFAAVTAEEAKQLGTTLTPWGAEQAGNKDGTIPAYGKDVIKVPSGSDPKKPGLRLDPFANEKPLFTVTAANMAQYADKVTEGMKEVLRKYPTMRMDVYPSHRTAIYPQYVIDNTIKNATACKAVKGGNKLEGCFGGLPFPIPKSGAEAVWNKLTAYTAAAWQSTYEAVMVDASGSAVVQAINEAVQESPYYDPSRKGVVPDDEVYWRIRLDTVGPTRKAGEKLLIVDNVDMVGIGRKAWQYLPGQRRVKLSPDLAYDTPTPQTGGASIMDEQRVFLGAPDRYDWKLVGKKEMFIPYNNFRTDDPAKCPGKVLFTKNHPNPDCVRWETHRVWVVEGALKPGLRHIYPKRTLYIDEDAPQATMGEGYDSSGKMYRVNFAAFFPMYEAQGLMGDMAMIMDLQTGAWSTSGYAAEHGGWSVTEPKGAKFYTPDALAAAGLR